MRLARARAADRRKRPACGGDRHRGGERAHEQAGRSPANPGARGLRASARAHSRRPACGGPRRDAPGGRCPSGPGVRGHCGRRSGGRRRGRIAAAAVDPHRQCAPLRALRRLGQSRGGLGLGEANGRRRRPRHRCRGSRANLRALLQSGRSPLTRRRECDRSWRRAGPLDRALDRRAARGSHPRGRQGVGRGRSVRGPSALTSFLAPRAALWGMYNVNPEHAIGLIGGLVALVIALAAMRLHPRWRSVPGTVRAAAVLMIVTAGVHLALIPHHLAHDPLTSVLFLLNGIAFIALAVSFTWRHWRLASAGLLIATVIGYLLYVGVGLEGPDQGGIATKLIEVTALGLALVPVRGEARPTHRSWRWVGLGVAMPLLIVMTGATVWIVDPAPPDAPHLHPGALLPSTNYLPTPAHGAAAPPPFHQTD